ncbi:MAG: hypothetical protein KC620_06725 [Myxococcales bacterium]|nr:hypothetical protein [Myxococcales bacterium]
MRRLFLLLTIVGCTREAPPVPDAAPPAAAPIAAAAPAEPDEAERRAKFEARPAIEAPADLPIGWRRLIASTGARLTEAHHAVRSQHVGPPAREVRLSLRLFGPDDEVEAKLITALKALDLSGLGEALPKGPVEDGPVRWSIEFAHLVAPRGEPREHRVELRWRRAPTEPSDPPRCRKPLPVDAPADTPAWLVKLTERRSTRQRVTAEVNARSERLEVRLHMYFWNGFAHDEHVGQLAEAASRAGFVAESREGPRQRWRHENGATFTVNPDPSELHLGCELRGPVLELVWTSAR